MPSQNDPADRPDTALATPTSAGPAIIPAGKSPAWLAFALVSSSYFVALFGLLAFCVVVP